MNLSGDAKVIIGIGLVTLAILIGAVFFFSSNSSSGENTSGAGQKVDQTILIKEDSYQQGPKNVKVTVVEFLDFECEACGAAYPTVEQIRNEYAGKINFVVRYFPLHKNSVLAKKAAEAAGEQGKFWEMYKKLFENQTEWGEKNIPQTELFNKYAKDLGLDMDKFKKGLENKAYEDKINRDKNDGIIAGVKGTPTFFINGVLAGNVMSYEEFKSKIDAELGK